MKAIRLHAQGQRGCFRGASELLLTSPLDGIVVPRRAVL